MLSSGWREPCLLEREAELAVLRDALTTVGGGHGRLVVVLGPPGAGKSRLLGAARDMATAAGVPALLAHASELERDVPFGVAKQLLGSPAGPLMSSPSPSAEDVSYALIERFAADLLARVHPSGHEARPLLLVVDDLQWSDPPSLRLLAHLLVRLERLPVGIVVAARQEETDPDGLLERLVTHRLARVISPSALSATATGELAQSIIGHEIDDKVLAACVRATGGLPFYIVELVRELASNPELTLDDVEQAVPLTVLRTVMARLGRLGGNASSLAMALAVTGDGVDLATVAALAEMELTAAEEAADLLARHAFIAAGEPLRFTHPLISSTIRADMGAFARARMHRRAADLVEREGAPVERIAAHLLHARPSGDAAVAARLSEGATVACRRGQPALGIKLLERALKEPPPPGERGHVLLQLAEAQAMAGSPLAVDNLQAALSLMGDGQERTEAALALARTLHHAGRYGEAAEIADRCRRSLPDGDPLEGRALASWLASALLHPPLFDRLTATVTGLLESVERGRVPSDPSICALLSAWLNSHDAPVDLVVELAAAAFAADPLVDGDSRGAAMGYAASTLVYADALEPAAAVLDAAVAAAHDRGTVIALAIARHFRCQLYLHLGRLAEAQVEGERSLEVVLHGWAPAPWSTPTLTLISIERGDLARAAEMVRLGETGEEGRVDWSMLREARARLRLAQNQPEAALADARAAGAHSDGLLGVTSSRLFDWVRIAALAAHELGRADEADELAGEAVRRGRAAGGRHLGAALLAAGVVAGGEDGVQLISEACAALERSAAALEQARAQLALGSALRHAGRGPDAREPLLHALELAGPMGAAPLVARARAELAALGLRPRRPARAGPSALTPTERRVAELAGEGLTTPMIAGELTVSAKTVEFHLTRAFRKLGIRSRRELPAALDTAPDTRERSATPATVLEDRPRGDR